MRRKTISEVMDSCVKELCRRVNAPFPPPEGVRYEVDDFTWTEAEQDDFAKWLGDYLYSLSMFKYKGKKNIAKEVSWFIFMYGWKCEEKTKETEE